MSISQFINILNGYEENSLLPKDILFHHSIKIINGRKTYKEDQWFKNIVLNELKNLLPFLSIYPVELIEDNNSITINRKIAIGSGLNSEELEMINSSVGSQYLKNKSVDSKIKILATKETEGFLFVLIGKKVGEDKKEGNGAQNKITTEYFEILLQKRNLGKDHPNGIFRESFLKKHKFNMASLGKYLEIIFNIANQVLNLTN